MNVLLLDHAPVVGGAEVVLVGLAGALDRDRWTPLVATSEEPAFRSLLADVDVESIPVPMGHLNGSGAAMPIHLTAAVRAVSRLVRRRLARGFDRREQVARTMGIYDTAVRRTTRG